MFTLYLCISYFVPDLSKEEPAKYAHCGDTVKCVEHCTLLMFAFFLGVFCFLHMKDYIFMFSFMVSIDLCKFTGFEHFVDTDLPTLSWSAVTKIWK